MALFEEALTIERSLPEPSGNLPYLLLDLGGSKQYNDDFAGAEALIREALAVMERKFGADDPRTAFPHNILGALFAETGDYPRALEQFRIVRDIARRLPPNADIFLELGSRGDLEHVVTLTERIANPDRCLAARAVVALGELRLKLRSTQDGNALVLRGAGQVASACSVPTTRR